MPVNILYAALFGGIAGLLASNPWNVICIAFAFVALDVIFGFSLFQLDMSQTVFVLPWAILASFMHMIGFAVFLPVGFGLRSLLRRAFDATNAGISTPVNLSNVPHETAALVNKWKMNIALSNDDFEQMIKDLVEFNQKSKKLGNNLEINLNELRRFRGNKTLLQDATEMNLSNSVRLLSDGNRI